MKSKIIVSEFSIDLYEADITLIVGEDIETIQKYVNEKIAKVDVSDTEGCVFEHHSDGRFKYYIVLVRNKINHNLVAHEIYHLGISIMKGINITDEEATAWVIGYITQMIYAILSKKNLISLFQQSINTKA